jgi:lipoate-protein ligase B
MGLMIDLPFQLTDLGRMAYLPALEIQRATHQRVLDHRAPATVLLVEHDPVITVSRRRAAAGHVLADAARLAALGIEVQPTDRGGDVTYHGPGQLVAYPILHLHEFNLNISRYMRLLEQAAIDAAGAFGVAAERDPGFTGVWVSPQPGEGDRNGDAASFKAPGRKRKLCAMGVRVSRGVTMHGLAFNVAPDMSHFSTIVPCGLPDRGVTSLAEILGPAAPAMPAVKAALIAALARQMQNCHAESHI